MYQTILNIKINLNKAVKLLNSISGNLKTLGKDE